MTGRDRTSSAAIALLVAFSSILFSMAPGSDIRSPAVQRAERGDLLVLGYRGTLIPDPARTGGGDETSCFPKFSLEPWLRDALRAIGALTTAEQRAVGGEPIDLQPFIDALRDRLQGILTLALAVCRDASPEGLFAQFPLLARLLKATVAEWSDATAVFLARLHSDAPRLAAWLEYARLPRVLSITSAGSDFHAGGHQVLRLLFRDGRALYYKPRAVTGEWLWDQLVQTVNAHSALRLASARVLAGRNDRYGWVTALQPHGASQDLLGNSTEAGSWWHAAGATLCLAEHMRMTDLHMGNVMATASGPALFDTESLGTPRVQSRRPRRPRTDERFADAIDDLLDTGLLPRPSPGGLPDTSGLFGHSAATSQILVPLWRSGSDGRPRLESLPATLVDQGNAPPGATPLQALPHLVSGYREAAAALMRCRDTLLSPGSVWRRTLECSHAPRIVLRDTLHYGLLLSRSLEPEQLRSAQLRQIALRGELFALQAPTFPAAVFRAEVRALQELHVPRFTVIPGSRTLAGGPGRPLVPRYLACSPAESVLRKVNEITPARLDEIHLPSLMMVLIGHRR